MSAKPKKRFSGWNLIWIVPLIAVLALAVMMYVIPALEGVDRTEAGGSSDWMSHLSDDTPLSDVILPGTHDSATKFVQLAYFSKCQALSIGKQLEAGYRYLDIRLGADGDKLKLMHGFTNCTEGGFPWSNALYLDNVLADCYSFLKAHPGETVIFAVKQEHGGESVLQFERLLDGYISKNEDMWLHTSSVPTVGEARGKLVLMRRYQDEAALGDRAGIPLIWPDQGGHDDVSLAAAAADNGSYTLTVQDRYEYGAEDKWKAFTKGLTACETGENSVLVNFLSTKGTATYGHPYAFAKQLNAKLLDLSEDQLHGWVIVDFASAKLAQHIYEVNFR